METNHQPKIPLALAQSQQYDIRPHHCDITAAGIITPRLQPDNPWVRSTGGCTVVSVSTILLADDPSDF